MSTPSNALSAANRLAVENDTRTEPDWTGGGPIRRSTRDPSTATKEPRAAVEYEADKRAADEDGRGRVAAPLGSTQSKCTIPDRRRARWAARAALWQASTLKPVRCCGFQLSPVMDRSGLGVVAVERSSVDVRSSVAAGDAPRASFSGLMCCGSVWACPRCASVVAAHRSVEIASAVAKAQELGGQVHFLTLTVRHRAADELSDLFEAVTAGWRAVTGSTAWAGDRARLGDRNAFGIAGVFRVLEATVSKPGAGGHGLHLHVHALVFSVGALSVGLVPDADLRLSRMLGHPVAVDPEWLARVVLTARIASRWARGVMKAGGRAPGAASVDLRTVADGGAELVSRYLAKATYDVAAKLGAELGAGELTKSSASEVNSSPFGLLHWLLTDPECSRFGFRTPRQWVVSACAEGFELVDLATGESTPLRPPPGWARWLEWEQATRGRRQIAWSLRPRRVVSAAHEFWVQVLDARGIDAEASDQDLAARENGGDLVGSIDRSAWLGRLVWRPAWLPELLEAAEAGPDEFGAWCAARGVELLGVGVDARAV